MKTIFTACTLLFSIVGFTQTDLLSQHKADPQAKEEAKKKIESIRQDILSGKIDFATAAKTYSMDPGSASQGGSFTNIPRGTFVPEFETVVWSAKEKIVSDVFETNFGYHILMVDAKRGDTIDVRHILIIPK
ncbi:MAG: peptidyl-prolyl cis-trans isomerase [Bacteroidetes bacterium]|nr:peptidyl-prolyl cis-trans isomerase [Bacteroidota bacterium]